MFWEYRKGWLHIRMWFQLSWSRHNSLVTEDKTPHSGVSYKDGRNATPEDVDSDGTETIAVPPL
ncbi:TPA_asm: hypothetical protein [ssRNA phage Zoerhiza.4_20]|uniref:Uncharacterized protein n=1 Tax=ssRNA phage Zoerhiza.4_20 TaxID=2786837 RepID=A0A8S5L436_9VIRU|nr:hypothetical protein QIO73_gp3 [ssRNA phage Zoerhiza.4_20]DAD51946.1 TPA_asm: hypothetical protein [ssRNA phage Zoerhiza.4_20]